ncbi:MAG: amidohydrolase family protein [Rhodopila sp.]|nr:amidohydrolase family protein [Rhodopila sp.]
MAREVNEYAAKVVADHPGRFGFYATLTLPDVDGALAEAAYALDTLHADGVVLHAHSKGTYLGDPRFDPLMDELNRRKAVVFAHPSTLPGDTVPGIPAYVADLLPRCPQGCRPPRDQPRQCRATVSAIGEGGAVMLGLNCFGSVLLRKDVSKPL